MSCLEDIKLDLAEVNQFLEQAKRPKVKELLEIKKRSLETEITRKQEELSESADVQEEPRPVPVIVKSAATPPAYTVRITNYAWDQSDVSVKLYITLNDVQTLPKEDIQVNFGKKNLNFLVKNLNGKNHQLNITALTKEIIPEKSSFKVKKDNIVLFLKKTAKETWTYLTQQEAQSKEKKMPKMDENKDDPSAGIMAMMKQMYDEGDDEMKRTIAKSWEESRKKSAF